MSDRDELEIVIPDQEGWDSEKEEFVKVKGCTLKLKHSLLSISKWEMKWKKPYLKTNYKMTQEESIDYIRCMTLTQNVDPNVYYFIPSSEMKKVNDYISTSLSAYTNFDKHKKGTNTAIVSERIYYWMSKYNIPSSYEKWHISRLMNLLKIAFEDGESNNQAATSEMVKQRHDLNMARRKALGSRG